MTRKAQKLTERRILDRFLKSTEYLDPIEIIPFDPPDFLIKTERGSVGVDVTEMFVSTTRKAQESLQQIVRSSAQAEFSRIDSRSAYVTFRLKSLNRLPKREAAPLGREIARFLHEHWQVGEERWVVRRGRLQVRRLASIDALELPPEAESIWWIPEAFAMPDVGRDAVQDVLDKKNAKSQRMRKSGCDELWLIIAVDTGSASASYQIGDNVKSFVVESKFDRVFLMNPQYSQVVELAVRRIRSA